MNSEARYLEASQEALAENDTNGRNCCGHLEWHSLDNLGDDHRR